MPTLTHSKNVPKPTRRHSRAPSGVTCPLASKMPEARASEAAKGGIALLASLAPSMVRVLTGAVAMSHAERPLNRDGWDRARAGEAAKAEHPGEGEPDVAHERRHPLRTEFDAVDGPRCQEVQQPHAREQNREAYGEDVAHQAVERVRGDAQQRADLLDDDGPKGRLRAGVCPGPAGALRPVPVCPGAP